MKLIFSIFLLTSFISAQSVSIRGTIIDEETQEVLVAANLQIKNTYRGTITNENGQFILEVEKFPVTVQVTYIGYARKEITLKEQPQKSLLIELKPVVLETEAIVVTAENPAMVIMRKVIANKLLWFDSLKTYKVDAYARVVLSNDSGVVSVAESISEGFWDNEKGPREVIKSKRQTENIKENQVFAFSSYIPNFYADDIEIQGFTIPGPTHKDAFDFYEFRLLEKKALGRDTVFIIEIVPTAKLDPTFIGTVSVLDSVFALLAVDVKPNPETVFYPMPIDDWNVFYKQQFSNFGGKFWLPVDMRANGDVKISLPGLDFPRIEYSRFVRLTDYLVNIDLPDTLYEEEKVIRIDSIAVAEDSLFNRRMEIIPLTKEEEVAYIEIDSTDTFEKAFKPSGFLASMITNENDGRSNTSTLGGKFLSFFSPDLGFNRVEGGRLGVGVDEWYKRLNLKSGALYKTQPKDWDYKAGLDLALDKKRRFKIGFEYSKFSQTNYLSDNYARLITGFNALMGYIDYFDYFQQKGFDVHLSARVRPLRSFIEISGLFYYQKSFENKITNYNLLGFDRKRRINPLIDEGRYNALRIKFRYGEEYIPFGVVAQKTAELRIEHSNPDWLNSDFDFTRYDFLASWSFNTFLTRRILPNTLNLQFKAGYSQGTVPLQKLGAVDVSLGAFSPFGVFRTSRSLPYLGNKYAAFFWEHNFRSAPFELLGGTWFAKKNIGFIVHGASGRAWLDNEYTERLGKSYPVLNDYQHEIGFSINGLFELLRTDFSWRLDRPGFYIGFNVLRWL